MEKIFKSLSDTNRRKILTILKNGGMSVNEIVVKMDIGQATVSNHLSILKKAGLVLVKNQTKQRIYSINWDVFNKFIEEINKFSGINPIISDEIIMRRI